MRGRAADFMLRAGSVCLPRRCASLPQTVGTHGLVPAAASTFRPTPGNGGAEYMQPPQSTPRAIAPIQARFLPRVKIPSRGNGSSRVEPWNRPVAEAVFSCSWNSAISPDAFEHGRFSAGVPRVSIPDRVACSSTDDTGHSPRSDERGRSTSMVANRRPVSANESTLDSIPPGVLPHTLADRVGSGRPVCMDNLGNGRCAGSRFDVAAVRCRSTAQGRAGAGRICSSN